MSIDEESEISLLVSNLLDGKNFSHCRLCLKLIKDDQFARFYDSVDFTPNKTCVLLKDVFAKIFGIEISNIIEGIDAICSTCLDKSLETYNFIIQYEDATQKLHKVLDNLTTTLDNDNIKNLNNVEQALYIICSEEEARVIYVQNNEQKPQTTLSIKCNNCKDSFEDTEEFIKHNKEQHKLFTCQKCMYTTENENELTEHETSNVFYKCDGCPQFCCTEESIQEHQGRSHGVYVCKECGKSFKGLDKLLAHEQKHVVKNECPKCGKTYTTKEFFEKHVTLCLEDRVEPHPMRSKIVKTYFCQECGKGYSTPGGLRVHQRFIHGNAEHHVCKECGKKFTAPCYLKVHMVTHTKEKNFPCDLCQGRYVSKEALLYHRRRHTGEKPYSCHECGERFVNASARVEHIKFKHIGPTLSCEICSRKFVTKNILRIHIEKHYDPTNKLYIGRADLPRLYLDNKSQEKITE